MKRRIFSIIVVVFLSALMAASGCCGDKTPIEVTGKVLSPDGSPAAGAVVEVFYPDNGTKAIADASGGFKLTLSTGNFGLRAHLGNLVSPSDLYLELSAKDASGKKVEMKLAPGAVITGKLIDKSTNSPVSGAKVMLRHYAQTETDIGGVFLFESVPQRRHTITAVKEGYFSPIVHLSAIGQEYVEVPLTTKPEGIIKGTVTDEKGNPVVGARVGEAGVYFDFQRSKTDEQGHYVLKCLDPDEKASIGVYADGFNWVSEHIVLFPEGKREATADFKLVSKKDEVRSIKGRVLKQDGTSIKDATVAYGFSDSYVGFKKTRTDDQGKFLLKDVDNTKNIVMVEAKGFAPSFKFVAEKVDVEIEFRMEPGHWIEGRLVDEEGKPLEDIWVYPVIESEEMTKFSLFERTYDLSSHRTTSDKDGRFRFDDLTSGRVFISAYKEGYSRIDQMPLAVDKKDHVIVLKRPGRIAGTVVDAKTSKPVTRYKVRSYNDSRGMDVNSSNGTFAYSGWNLTPGDKTSLIIEAPGYLRAKVPQAEVVSASKINFSALKIRLRPSEPVKGTVTEAGTGKPLSGVLITVFELERQDSSLSWGKIPEQLGPVSTRTGSDGKFRLESAPARIGAVMLEKSGYGRTLVRDVDLFKPFKASMPRAAAIKGVALDDSGKPMPKAHITLRKRDRAYSTVSFGGGDTGPDGIFKVTDLPPGSYSIEQHGKGRSRRLHFVNLKAGQEYTVDWNKPGESQLECKVLHRNAPVVDAHIMLHPMDDPMYAAVGSTGKDGKAVLNITKAAEYRVTASMGDYGQPDYVESRARMLLKKGRNTLTLRFPDGSISGKVIARDGKPMAGVSVQAMIKQTEDEYLQWSDYMRQHTQAQWWAKKSMKTGPDGSFAFSDLDAGKWMISVQPDLNSRAAFWSKTLELGRGQQIKALTVRAPQTGSAEIAILDAKTAKPVTDVFAVCVGEEGQLVYPEKDKNCSGGG